MGKLYAGAIVLSLAMALLDQSWQPLAMCQVCENGYGGATRCERDDSGAGCKPGVGELQCDSRYADCRCHETRNGCPCTMARQ